MSRWILCHSVHLDADSNSPQEEYEFSWWKNIHDGDDRSTIIMVVMIIMIMMVMMMIFKVVTTMTKDINSRWWPRSGHENEKDNENENYSNDEIHRWLRSDPTNCICTGKTFDRWKKFLKWNFPAIFHGNFLFEFITTYATNLTPSFVGISSFKEKFKIKVYKITFYLYISKIKSKFPIYSEKLKVNENYISSLSLIFCVSLYLSNSTSTVFGGSDMLHVER